MRMSDMMLENPLNRLVLLDRFEWRDAAGNDPLTWDLDAWIGRDLTKLWIRSEGERRSDDTERAELEILFGRTFARWWDFVAGVRHDAQPSPDRSWAAVGVRGTAPYRFEIEATAYVGDGNRTALRFETQRDLLITNRLILQPQLELNWHGQADRARSWGSGLVDAEIGLRLRYEIRREVAPYVGVTRERSFGRTAELRHAAGRDADDTRWVAGIRVWF
jgi:copper resistance protein B